MLQLALHALDKFHKRLDAFARVGLERRRDQRIFHGGENGAFPVVARAEEPFHRDVAQAARGGVGDAQQADVVVRIDENFQVGEEILDLASVKKTLSADEMIADIGRAQRGFQRARLLVRAEQDRTILPGNPIREPLKLNRRHDFARLVLVVAKSVQQDFCARALAGPQIFSAPLDVVLDDGVRGVENGRRAAVILFELDDFDFGEMLFQIQQVGDFRAAPAVDALVVVADDAKIPVLLRERMH